MSVQVLFASGPTEVPCSGFQEHSCGSHEGDSRHRSGTDSSYQPCPETVISSRLGRGLRSSVQMAPTTVQSKWATTHPALVASSHNRGSYSAVWAGSPKGRTRFEHIRRQAAVQRKPSWPGAVPTQATHMSGGATRLACGSPVHGAAVGAIRQPPQRTLWV